MSSDLVAETLRLYQRYQLEIVEALNLCPWAKRARLDGHVRQWVSVSEAPTTDEVLAKIDEWTQDETVEIGLAIFPRYSVSRSEFERFANSVMDADARRSGLRSPTFVLAAFHPDADCDTNSAERLIPFLRRTPDPTLQIVRVSALERVRHGETAGTQFIDTSNLDLSTLSFTSGGPPLRDRVASANLSTIQQLGVERARGLIEDIHRDRARSRRAPSAQASDEDDASQ